MIQDTHNHFRTFLLLGFWVLILLYVHIPAGWKNFLWVMTAFALFYQAYREHIVKQREYSMNDTIETKTFVETTRTNNNNEHKTQSESVLNENTTV